MSEAPEAPITSYQPVFSRVRVERRAQAGSILFSILSTDRKRVLCQTGLTPSETVDFVIAVLKCAGLKMIVTELDFRYADGTLPGRLDGTDVETEEGEA